MMLAPLKPMKSRMREAGLFAKLCVRQLTPRFAKELPELNIEAFSHCKTMPNSP